MHCAISYHLHHLKNMKNIHGGVSGFTKSNTPLWMFFKFFKLYKWYQIAQNITYILRKQLGQLFRHSCFNLCYEVFCRLYLFL